MKGKSPNKNLQLLKYTVGIDISKDKFDACISTIDTEQRVKVVATRTFSNETNGFNNLFEWVLNKQKLSIPLVYIMESTGIYYERLAFYLHKNDLFVVVILPNKSKKYMQSLGYKTKNDKIDAQGLARMAAEQRLEKWEAPSASIMELRSITRQRENLQESRTQFNNQLCAIKCGEFANQLIIDQLVKVIELIDLQIKETHILIENHVEKDVEIKSKISNILAIKGVAIVTVATVVAETNGFKMFNSLRQLVSFSGYDVIENQSGKHTGKTKISKKGNTHIRRILHLPAFNVVRYDEPIFRELYERVYERTKIKMKGYVAVQRKLLELIYTLWKTEKPYDKNYRNINQTINNKICVVN